MQRISLSNVAFEGANNAYLFTDGPETVLVDTGDATDTTREQLAAGLAEEGVTFADVDRIFLTHWHHDHVGLAGDIQAESGASVHVHTADAALVEGDEDAWADIHELQARLFEQWGMPEAKQQQLRERMTGIEDTGIAPDVTTFEDGDTFSVNDHRLRVVHASGHAAGLCVFELDIDGQDVALTGDALLPKYTPNVGGADVRVDRALQRYLEALRAIAAADYDRAYPGHREPIEDPTGRAERIIAHHEERAWRVFDALDRLGPCDPWTVSADLFGQLEGIHILHGPGEAAAHLDHLVARGEVESEGTDYRLSPAMADRLASRTDERWPLDS